MPSVILLLEDETEQRELLGSVLEGEGYQIIGADSAEIALEKLEKRYPDVIIADIKLPKMDGLEFFHEVKKRPELRNVPFIFVTAFGDPTAIEEVVKLGATYITKPYQIEGLLAAIKKASQSRRVR